MSDLALVALASAAAGCVDAIVGGGGLVLVPALFSVYPAAAPATLFGTNKSAAVWGTGWAAWQLTRRVTLPWRAMGPAVPAALLGSWAGAWTVTQISADGLRRVLPFVLLAVLVYTVRHKHLGRQHQPLASHRREAVLAASIALTVGFYDGFFGPGTGSFFVFLFVRLLGYDFLHASAGAKLLNTATNVAAVVLFGIKGHVWWSVALVLALANVAGSLLGTRLALRHGAGFVRVVFIGVVSLLIVKTGWNGFAR
jgi:uncharacterized membrane protein YfcA